MNDLTGIFDLPFYSVIEIAGTDAADYLHRMSTANVKGMQVSDVLHVAFLNGKGQVLCLGMLIRRQNSYDLLLAENQVSALLDHLEAFHFSEVIGFQVKEVSLLGIWHSHPQRTSLRLSSVQHCGLELESFFDDCRAQLEWVLVDAALKPRLLKQWNQMGLKCLSGEVFHYHRIRAGVPQWGQEIGEGTLFSELNFERAAAEQKGCYPGQEVVERIKTYGAVQRKLLVLESDQAVGSLPEELWVKKEVAGELVSFAKLEAGMGVGMAYLARRFWECAEDFQLKSGQKLRKLANVCETV